MLHAIIMAGGSGTRFWPASRRDHPKQFLALATDQPLLRMTFERLIGLVPSDHVWVVTTAATAQATREMLPELPAGNVLAEPVGRNTAACVGFAAHVIMLQDPEATCVVLPADHIIGDDARFRSAMAAGAEFITREGGLLTFGIQPAHPETGFGYLEIGSEQSRDDGWTVHVLERFVEKPDLEHARAYVDSGEYLWNAGIFAWRAADLLEEISVQLPELGDGLQRIAQSLNQPDGPAILDATYPTLPSTSVDFGIMEGARRCWTMPVDFQWSDIGSWAAAADTMAADQQANAIRGRAVALEAFGNVVVSTGPVVSVVGVDDLVVIATPDAVLVVPKDQSQRVKEVVEALGHEGWDDVL